MKPEMTDQELDHLLSELTDPDIPDGLMSKIMAGLPERKLGWRATLLSIFGIERLAAPATGAFAALAFGFLAGYGLAPSAMLEEGGDDAETALSLAFGGDTWFDLTEETS